MATFIDFIDVYGKALFSMWGRERPVSVGLHILNVTVNVTLSVSCTHDFLAQFQGEDQSSKSVRS